MAAARAMYRRAGMKELTEVTATSRPDQAKTLKRCRVAPGRNRGGDSTATSAASRLWSAGQEAKRAVIEQQLARTLLQARQAAVFRHCRHRRRVHHSTPAGSEHIPARPISCWIRRPWAGRRSVRPNDANRSIHTALPMRRSLPARPPSTMPNGTGWLSAYGRMQCAASTRERPQPQERAVSL